MYKRSSWQFDEEVTTHFEQHVRKSLPFYDRLQTMIVNLSDYFLTNESVVYDLGCSKGETLAMIHNRHKNKQLKLIGIDSSESMIEHANKLHDSINIYFQHTKLESFDFSQMSPMIIASLTLHFIPIPERKKLLDKIYNALYEGGSFVFVEKTHSSSSVIQQMFTHLHYDDKSSHGFSESDIIKKEQSLRSVLTPLSVDDNVNLLQSAGFTVDTFFKDWHFTGFLAIKPVKF